MKWKGSLAGGAKRMLCMSLYRWNGHQADRMVHYFELLMERACLHGFVPGGMLKWLLKWLFMLLGMERACSHGFVPGGVLRNDLLLNTPFTVNTSLSFTTSTRTIEVYEMNTEMSQWIIEMLVVMNGV